MDSLCRARALKFIFVALPSQTRGMHIVGAPSTVLSLERFRSLARISLRHGGSCESASTTPVKHRFEEHINGRAYLIEVSSVGVNQWRAQIARTPGGSAALMPFYGRTPDEAAQHLSRWLSLLHGTTPSSPAKGDPRRI